MTLRRIVLAVKADGYGDRAHLFQDALQEGLESVLAMGAERAGLHRGAWALQESGDGEVAVLPESEPEHLVVGRLVPEINSEIHQHNRLAAENVRLRLRLAIHFGPATPSTKGFSGDGPVLASVLCGSRQLRSALDQTGCELAVTLSDEIYTGTVKALRVPLVDPGRMRKVRVREHGVDVHSWLWLPGHDAFVLRLEDVEVNDEEDDEDPPGESAPTTGPMGQGTGSRKVTIKKSRITTNGPLIVGDQINNYFGRGRER